MLLDRGCTSELDASGSRRRLAAQPGTHVPLDRDVDIGGQLLVEIPLDPFTPEQRAKAGEHAARNAEHQASPSVARMIFAIAAVWASHSRVASASRRRPAAVRA